MIEGSNDPKISVIIAIKDSERFLPQALASVGSQTFNDYEIVVVDGASTDNGPALARAFPRTICIPQNGSGFAHAWNVGIEASRGEYLTFLDSDDLWSTNKLELQLAAFERNPETEYVYGRVRFFLEPGTSLPKGFRPSILAASHPAHMPGAAMVKRSRMQKTGLFDLRLRIASDISWFAKLRDGATTAFVDEVLLEKRLHHSNLSHTTSWQLLRSELFEILRERTRDSREESTTTSHES